MNQIASLEDPFAMTVIWSLRGTKQSQKMNQIASPEDSFAMTIDFVR